MQEERDCQCEVNRNCGMFNGLFNGCGCNNDSTILFFIIVFLLLFTNSGCCNR